MTDYVSLELSKQIYEATGWNDTKDGWHLIHDGTYRVHAYQGCKVPAYTIGFILDKLPRGFTYKTPRGRFVNVTIYLEPIAEGMMKCIIASVDLSSIWWQSYGTPADALAKLLLQLIKEKVVVL